MLNRLRSSKLLRNTLWMFAGQGARIVLQAVYFVLIARALGVEGYGEFVGAVALVAILAPFASIGRGELLVKVVSRNPAMLKPYWGYAILMTVGSGALLMGLTLLASRLIFPEGIGLWLLLWVALSDLILYRLLDICSQVYQAQQKLKRTAQLQAGMSLIRTVCAVAMMAMFDQPTAAQWGMLYMASTAIGLTAALTVALKECGLPSFTGWRSMFRELKEGSYFSISHASVAIYNDINKTMLVQFGSLSAAGVFASASRIVEVALTPIRSLMGATYSRFFQEGAKGIEGTLAYARKLVPIAAAYGLLAGIGVYLTAPYLPVILGDEYAAAVGAMQGLALIPILKSLQSFTADAMTGAGYQGVRSSLQIGTAAVNVGLNIWLIPLYSWQGAVISTIATNAALTLAYWIVIAYLVRQAAARRALAARRMEGTA